MLACLFSNWLVSKAIGLNSFDEISIELFLVKFGLCVKMICLFDQFFIRHFEGIYRSATAPPVQLSGGKSDFILSNSMNEVYNLSQKDIKSS